MTDQVQNQSTESAQVEKPDTTLTTSTATVTTGNERTFTQAEVERLIKDRLERETAKRIEGEKAAAEKAAAEEAKKNGEWQKLAEAKEKELSEAKASIAARDLADKKRSIADKVGLPAAFANRLIGATDEELEADAKALLETIPKQATKPNTSTTNPGANGSQNETRQQKKARLEGTSIDPFAGGGGIFWGEKPEG